MIRMIDVFKEYSNGIKALKGVSIFLGKGDFAFLVGPSGSGKSTIIKLLTGEIAPTDGSIVVNGFDLTSIKMSKMPNLRRTIGVIFQDFRLIEDKNVYENVAFAMRVVGATNKEIRKRIPYVLHLVGLDGRGKAMPQELSGGEQQRVAIARALATNVDVILADEPTGNLDEATSEDIVAIFQDLAHEHGKCVIVVTHDKEIAQRSDAMLMLYKGRLSDHE